LLTFVLRHLHCLRFFRSQRLPQGLLDCHCLDYCRDIS
jgi:hypothetical protein